MTGTNPTPEALAWMKIQEPAPRARYEHAQAWEKRNRRRQNFVKRIDRRPDGCWVWTGPKVRGKSAEYTLFCYRNGDRGHNRSAFVWMMEEWFPNTRVTPKHRTSTTCGDDLCISPFHRQSMRLTNNTLTADDVRLIYAAKGVTPAGTLAEQYGVSQSTVSNIWTGKRWADVTGKKYTAATRAPKQSITDEVILEIAALKGVKSTRTVGRYFGVSQATVARVWRGERRASLLQEQGPC